MEIGDQSKLSYISNMDESMKKKYDECLLTVKEIKENTKLHIF